jgi:hypothetical protein
MSYGVSKDGDVSNAITVHTNKSDGFDVLLDRRVIAQRPIPHVFPFKKLNASHKTVYFLRKNHGQNLFFEERRNTYSPVYGLNLPTFIAADRNYEVLNGAALEILLILRDKTLGDDARNLRVMFA